MKIETVIKHDITIKSALSLINKLSGKTLFIVDDHDKLIGTLSDGDIRRGLLSDFGLDDKVFEVMSRNFKYLLENEFAPQKIKAFKEANINFIPLLSADDKIIDILNLKQVKSILPLEAIIMAGGIGSRLKPLTNDTPKPMLKIADKPIIEYNIDRLISFGVKKIYISVNYLKNQIKDYFGDGKSKNIEIEYIEEHQKTGTLGSASYVDEYGTKEIIVMNSDILTNINFEDFYQTHLNTTAELTVASIPYEVNIPYGVIETKKNIVVSLKEKPTYTYYSNAGIYIIKTACINEIPKKSFYNATDLIEKLMNEKRKVVNFPIIDYWLDIGKPKDFLKAQEDVKHIQF